MDLFHKIIAIYPDLDLLKEIREGIIRLQNDGRGDYIAKWEHPTLPRPTDEQLEGVA